MALGFIPQECPQARPRSRRIRALLAASDGPADSSPRANKGWYCRDAPVGRDESRRGYALTLADAAREPLCWQVLLIRTRSAQAQTSI